MWTLTLDWSEEEASFLSGSVGPVQLAVDTCGKSFYSLAFIQSNLQYITRHTLQCNAQLCQYLCYCACFVYALPDGGSIVLFFLILVYSFAASQLQAHQT